MTDDVVLTGEQRFEIESLDLATKEPPPPGYLLYHNRRKDSGFRAYWAERDARFVLCNCGWRPDLGVHYVVPMPGMKLE
jgi:hypothetical protein